MQVPLHTIVKKLEHFNPVVIAATQDHPIIELVQPLCHGLSDPVVLYIGSASEIPVMLPPFPVNILCQEDIPLSERYKDNHMINVITLNTKINILAVFNEVQKMIFPNQQAIEGTVKLLSAMSHGVGLQKLIEMGSEMLGNPIVLSDMSYKCLAMSTNLSANGDPAWDEFKTQGYLSPETVHFILSNRKLTNKIFHSTAPFFWIDDYIKYPRMIGLVRIGSKPVANLALSEQDRPFRDSDIELVTILCDAISSELQKNKFSNFSRGLAFESFLEDLLDNTLTNSYVITERAQYLNLGLKKNKQIFVIATQEIEGEYFSLSYMRNLLETIVSNSKAIVYQDSIVLIKSSDHECALQDTEYVRLIDFLHKFKLRGALSRTFHLLEDIQEYYRQSLTALRIGMHMDFEKVIYAYDDYAIYHLAEVCSNYEELKLFCLPSLFVLMEYDAEKGTSLTQSLYYYLKNSRSIALSAEALHLKRSSMVYRLERIGQVMKVDIRDIKTLQHLDLSFILLEYEKKIPFKQWI